MAIKVGGTTVIDNSRELQNIATVDSTTVSTLNSALNVDPTKGTLTKTFTQNETADITLSSSITSGCPVVSATKEVPQTGVSTKGNWDVNSTASNYDFHDTAANVTLSHTVAANANISDMTQVYDYTAVNSYGPKPSPIFKPDGTMMFICSQSNAYIYTYNLSTAWDISTASYDGSKLQSTNAATSEGDPTDIFFKPDGTVLFYIGFGNDQVRAFNLSTAWDLSTASISTTNDFSTASQETAPKGLFFKPDGTKMYINGGNGNRTFQYNLSAAWDLTSASYTSLFNTALQDNSHHGVRFNSTGTKMYILGTQTNSMYQYTLATAWDITSASYDNVSKDFSSLTGGGDPHGFFIDSTGSRIYLGCGGSGSSRVYQFSNGQDALALGSGSFASTDVGKRIVGNGGDVILTATSGTYSTTGGSAFTDNSTIAAGSWSMFGLKSAGDADGITMSGISSITPINLANGSYDNKSASTSSQSNSEDGVFFKPDGTRMYVLSSGGSTNQVDQYNLSTAWDVSTASYASVAYSISSYTSNAGGIFFKPDGTKMYLADRATQQLDEYTLSTAWDLSTTSYTRNVGISTFNANPMGVFFKPDGTKVYFGDTNADVIREANVTTAWDITTISYNQAFNIGSQEQDIHDVEFTSDGTKMFIVGRGSDKIHQYTLSTAWDISSATYNSVFLDVSSQGAQPNGMHLKADDGTKFYVVNSSTNAVYQYSTGASQNFSQPTAQYNVAVTNSGGQIDSQYFTDINSMTAAESAGTGTAHYAVSTDGRTTWSVAKGTDGVRPIVRNNSGTWQYNSDGGTASTYQLTSPTYVQVKYIGTTNVYGLFMKPDGTRLYYQQYTGNLTQWNLATAYDVSTATVSTSVSSPFSGLANHGTDNYFDSTGTYYYITNIANNQVSRWTLSTPWDISTLGSNQNQGINVSGNLLGIDFKTDGTKMFLCTENSVFAYNLSTAWDNTSISSGSNLPDVTYSLASFSGASAEAIRFKSDGTEFYILDKNNSTRIYIYSLSTAWDISTASYSSYYQITESITTARALALSSDGNKMYIVDEASSARTYEYTIGSSAYGTSTTWVDGTTNDELYTLQEALGAQAFNRMDKTQLDAVADANHFSTGTSLDLMIALRMDTAASTLPTSDGVTLNYDAAALNEGAVLGTDYDFFFPANNKVQIKSLAAQNLKVRVV